MSLSISLGPLIIQKTLLFTIIGFISSITIVRLHTELSIEERKQRLEQVLNLLFYFVVSLLLAKAVVLHKLLLDDPLTIFVTPANKQMFYIALCFVMVYIFIQKHLRKMLTIHLLATLTEMLIVSETIYLFLSYTFLDDRRYFIPFLCLAVVVLFMFVNVCNQTFVQRRTYALFAWLAIHIVFSVSIKIPFFLYYVDSYFWMFLLLVTSVVWFNKYRTIKKD